MSSISSIGGLSGSFAAKGSHRTHGPEKSLQQDLASYLSAQGVSSDEQSTIQDEITSAIKSSVATGRRPDPKEIGDEVKKVLDSHGVDGAGFLQQFPPPPPFPGAPPKTQNAQGLTGKGDDKKQDSIQQLLDLLSQEADRNKQRAKVTSGNAANTASTATTTQTNGVDARSAVAATAKSSYQSAYSTTSNAQATGGLLNVSV